jgi:hypothetical protein
METNKAAGPDCIPVEFYKKCWEIIKEDIIEMFKDFHEGRLKVERINYGLITCYQKLLMLKRYNNTDQYAFKTVYTNGSLRPRQ